MIRKIIAYQKMLLKMLFSQAFNNGKQSLKGKISKVESIALIVSLITAYSIGLRIFGGLIGMMVFSMILIPHLYRLISADENILFSLPLKRSFVILNIYIFTIVAGLIMSFISMMLFTFMSLTVVSTSLLRGNMPQLTITEFDIAVLQSCILIGIYIMGFVNGLLSSFFIDKQRLRIAAMIVFTAVYSGTVLYIYSILPRNTKYMGSDLVNSLQALQNSWIFVITAASAVLLITFGGFYMAVWLDRTRRGC